MASGYSAKRFEENRGNRKLCHLNPFEFFNHSPWGKTHPKRARFNHPKSGRSWPFAKRVDCSIATNDEQPEYRVRAHDF
jgi:hypothetical protein